MLTTAGRRRREAVLADKQQEESLACTSVSHPLAFPLSRLEVEDPFPRRVGQSVFRMSVTLNENAWFINFKNLKEG